MTLQLAIDFSGAAQRRRLMAAERKAEAARKRYAKTHSRVALVRMRDAVTKALELAPPQTAPHPDERRAHSNAT